MQGTVGYALDRWDYRYPPNSILICNHTRYFNINLAIWMLSAIDTQLLSWRINACGNYFKGGYTITCTTMVLTWNVLWMIGLHILFGFTASQASPSSSLQMKQHKFIWRPLPTQGPALSLHMRLTHRQSWGPCHQWTGPWPSAAHLRKNEITSRSRHD